MAPDPSRVIETADADTIAAMAEALSPGEADLLGVRLARFGSVLALMTRRLDVLAFNRAVGIGVEGPADETSLDDMIGWYRTAGVPRFFVQLCPQARPNQLRDWLAERGLAHYNNWMKLWRRTDDLPKVVTDLRVERIGAGHAPQFATIVARGFAMPDAVRPWLVATVGRPGWRHYLAFAGDNPVAGGALFVRGDVGWLGFAATDAGHRGRGAQSALIVRRIADARALGCRRLVVETAEDTPERRATSFHNLRRLGFELAYVRPNYLWTPPPTARPAA